MTAKPLLAVAVSLALVAMASPAAADHFGDADRDAIYIGFAGVDHGLNEHWIPACEAVFGEGDCPTPIPSGIMSTSCDDGSWNGLGLFQGVGGGLFCNIPNTSTVGVAIHDPLIDPVVASVACLQDDGSGEVTWFSSMGLMEGSGTYDLQADCPDEPAQHQSDDPGTTRVGIFLRGPPAGAGASTGEITLNFV